FDYDTHYERVLNDMRAGEGTYDVVLLADTQLPMYAGGGFLVNLEELGYQLDEDDFAQASINQGMWPDPTGPRIPSDDPNEEPMLYAVPQVGNVQLFTWRKDILGETPPKTWNEAIEM